MRTIQRLIYLSILFQFLYTTAYSANHYVDKNANGLNNGTSWANAWQNFSAINWSSVQPGDVVFISGGTVSTTYYETLFPRCRGTSSNRITIIAGKYAPNPAGHSGRVIIDGQAEARHESILFDDYSGTAPAYVTVKGFECREGTAGVNFNIDAAEGICKANIIDSCTIYDWYDLAGVLVMGNADSTVIQNCRIVSFLDKGVQTDCFHFNGAGNLYPRRTVIHDNFIDNRNQDPNAHNDAIQSVQADGFIIYNNIIINDSVYSPEGGGLPFILGSIDYNYNKPIQQRNPVIIYNNFAYMGGAWYPNANMGYTLWTRYYSDQIHQPLTYIINNTIVTNGPRLAGVGQEYKIDLFINNIDAMYCLPDGVLGENWRTGGTHGWQTNFSANSGWSTAMPMDSVRHNLFWKQDNVQTLFSGGWKYSTGGTGGISGWSDWLSHGGTGVNADPKFVHNFGQEPSQLALDGELKANSPAVNAGENIQPYLNFFYSTWKIQLPTKDMKGNYRDVTHPSIGAYEYITGGGGNNPPYQPSNPNPVNGSTNQLINLTLSWSCSDPDGDPLTYDVYFGTGNNPPLVSGNQSNTSYNPGQLNNNTSYYWKIVAKDNQGATTSGPVWNFATVAAIVNNPPYPPSNPNPVNGATNQAINITLTWNCSDPDGNPLTYDVYFGTIDDPPMISSNQSNANFTPGTLNSNTTYYWRIVAKDNQGATTSGLVWNFSTVYLDQTPPQIANAELLDSVKLKIWFSEPVQQSGAQNISNYSINNGIQVLNASLSGSEVTLTTTVHSAGTYTLTVVNVKDLVGNQITPPNNTAQYEYVLNQTELINLEMKVFLDGAYTDNSMTTNLLSNSLIPLNQPYSVTPWSYYGSETVNTIPQNTVDWILLELRTSTSASSIVSRRAAFLRSDGIAVDLNGNTKVTFPGVQSGSYYVVVYHRNHLAIMTKNAIPLSESSTLYDFTTSQNKAYGSQAMKLLTGGKYGLYAADGNANGSINNSDNSSIWKPENGSVGYKKGDFDLNGGVNITDKNAKWSINKGKISYVPKN